MGLLGGDSKSESNAIDNRMVNDGGSIQLQRAKGATVSVTTVADKVVADALAAMTLAQSAASAQAEAAMRDALAASAAATQDAIDSANKSADRVAVISSDAMDNVSLIADKSQGYAWESASDALGMSMNVVDLAFESSRRQGDATMATVANIADAYQSARETEVTAQFQDYRYILIAGLIVVGIVAFKAVK